MGKCNAVGCGKRASFNHKDKSKGIYCSNHKLDDMVDVVNKHCIYEGCSYSPSCNLPGNKIRLYCSKHKLENMICVMNTYCQYEGCLTHPNYNLPNKKKGIYCSKHKLDDMIDVKNKRCAFIDGCVKRPNFNYKDQTTGLYCSEHKLENMIDVINKRCLHEGCLSNPSYNLPGNKDRLYCSKHKTENMIDVLNKLCQFDECNKHPSFNYSHKKLPIYCLDHKLDNMIDIKHKKCNTVLCEIRSDKKYKGYCFTCFIHMFPDEPNSRNYKTKEKYITDYIKEKISNVDWVVDRKVYDGCSRRRPDLYLDLGYQVLVVEIDENQHIDYDCSCENKRLMEISQDIGHRPLIFIRFNPDNYVSGENKITSCWSLDGNGICTVKKSKKKEWEERLTRLEYQIRYWLDPENKTDKTVEVVQLYYDQ